MNFLNIKETGLLEKDPIRYWQLFFLKSIFVFYIFSYVVLILLSLILNLKLLHVDYGYIYMTTGLVSMAGLHLYVSNSERYNFGATVLTVYSVFLMALIPYYTGGFYSPAFHQYPLVLLLVALLLGVSGALVVGGIMVFIVAVYFLSPALFYGTNIDVLSEFFHISLIRGRIISIGLTAFVLVIASKIVANIRFHLDNEKQMKNKSENYDILGKIASGFAHEINNPLGIASGNIYRLKKNDLYKEDADKFAKIEKSHQRISGVVSDFLKVFNSTPPTHDMCNVSELINSVMDEKSHVWKGVIQVDNFVSKNFFVSADKRLLKIVLEVLFENALEAVERSGESEKLVAWQLSKSGDLHCIDSGKGFERKSFQECLKPFSTQEDNHGKGLGLFLAKINSEKINAELTHKREFEKTVVGLQFNRNIVFKR